MKNNNKYDSNQESILDVYVYLPIANFLLPYLNSLQITPNMVTCLSTISTLFSIYFFYYNNLYCLIFYFLGYLLDAVDGKLARQYDMVTIFGMMFDMISDNLTNIPLIFIFLYKSMFPFSILKMTLIIFLLFFLSVFGLSFGINEALDCYNKNNDDNFFNFKKEIIDKSYYKDSCMAILFLDINKLSYQSYRYYFPNKINIT